MTAPCFADEPVPPLACDPKYLPSTRGIASVPPVQQDPTSFSATFAQVLHIFSHDSTRSTASVAAHYSTTCSTHQPSDTSCATPWLGPYSSRLHGTGDAPSAGLQPIWTLLAHTASGLKASSTVWPRLVIPIESLAIDSRVPCTAPNSLPLMKVALLHLQFPTAGFRSHAERLATTVHV